MSDKYDICVIGAGAGGLSVAAGASQLGVSVVLIEGNLMGGDCLNYGCIPSKALLSASKHYYAINNSASFGIKAHTEAANLPAILNTVHEIITQIAPNDSIERFTGLGVKVISGWAGFIDANTLSVNGQLIAAKYFVIASGAKATIPDIPGLKEVRYYTNETIFSLQENPQHLLVIGGGSVGCEMAQAFAMLGIKVSLIARHRILPKDEEDIVDILREKLLQCGVTIYENTMIDLVTRLTNEISLKVVHDQLEMTLNGSHLLIATGRTPNIEQLNLDKAQINYTKRGIIVDDRLRTSNKHIFAIGDVIGKYEFTHIAGYHAGIVIRNILFRQKAKVNYQAVPWVTYTYPEVAHVGLSQRDAINKFGDKVKITEFNLADNDRAKTSRETAGKIKLLTNHRAKVLGVSVIGANAGEMLLPWIDLINRNDSIKVLTKNIVPYPTLSEINKQVVSKYYTPILFSAKVRFIVKFLKLFW